MLPLDARHVLVCLRYGIGDVVMELPALSALRRALPDATITALATPPANELLEDDPRVDRTVLTSRWELRHRWDRGEEPTRRKIAEWIRDEGFDLHLDVRHAITAVSDAIWGAGVHSLESDADEEEAAIRDGRSGVEAVSAGVRAGWGLEVPEDARPRLRIRPADRAFADDLLRDLRVGGSRPFALSPVASNELKRWPAERLAAVADHVVERGAGPLLVLEGPQAEAGREVRGAMEHSDDAVRIGAHHLLRTAALLARCRGFVGLDTGLMHVAAAVGAPTVGVFGPTRGRVFLPPSPRTTPVEPEGVECRWREDASLGPPDCWKMGRCLIAERSCVHRTRLDDVVAAVDGILAQDEPEGGEARAPEHGSASCNPRTANEASEGLSESPEPLPGRSWRKTGSWT